MLSIRDALIYTAAMGLLIFFCRAFAFIVIRNNKPEQVKRSGDTFLLFIERIVPPVAMTVLAFSSVVSPLRENFFSPNSAAVIAASLATAALHIWKRNSLISIFTGTLIYMMLIRILH